MSDDFVQGLLSSFDWPRYTILTYSENCSNFGPFERKLSVVCAIVQPPLRFGVNLAGCSDEEIQKAAISLHEMLCETLQEIEAEYARGCLLLDMTSLQTFRGAVSGLSSDIFSQLDQLMSDPENAEFWDELSRRLELGTRYRVSVKEVPCHQ